MWEFCGAFVQISCATVQCELELQLAGGWKPELIMKRVDERPTSLLKRISVAGTVWAFFIINLLCDSFNFSPFFTQQKKVPLPTKPGQINEKERCKHECNKSWANKLKMFIILAQLFLLEYFLKRETKFRVLNALMSTDRQLNSVVRIHSHKCT